MTARELLNELYILPDEFLDLELEVLVDNPYQEYLQVEHLDWGTTWGDDEIEASKYSQVVLIVTQKVTKA